MESCKIYAMHGLGVAFVSSNHIRGELRDGRLVRLGGFVLDRPAYLISRKEQRQNALITVFKEMFVKHCKSLC